MHGEMEISMDNKQLPLNMQGSIQVKLNRQRLWYGIGWHPKKFWLDLVKRKKEVKSGLQWGTFNESERSQSVNVEVVT